MFRTRIVLGIAAAALSIASLISAATPASAAGPANPDLKVTYKGETGSFGAHFYVFDVKNIGTAKTNFVHASADVYRTTWSTSFPYSHHVTFDVESIPVGVTRTVTIACNDEALEGGGTGRCIGFEAMIYDSTEDNMSNNSVSQRRLAAAANKAWRAAPTRCGSFGLRTRC